MKRLAPLALLLATAIWGWTFVLVKEGMGLVGPFAFLAARFLLAAVVLAVLFPRAVLHTDRRTLVRGALVGLALFAGYVLQTSGLVYTTATKSGLFTGLSVAFFPLLASGTGRERIRSSQWVGALLAAGGLAAFILARGVVAGFNVGDVLTLACGVAFAVHLLLVDRFVRTDDYRGLLFVQVAVVALLSTAGTLVFERIPTAWPGKLVEAVLVTSLLATVLCFWLYNRFQVYSTPTYSAILFTMEPVFAGLCGFLLLGETLTPLQGAGAFLILLGMLVPRLLERNRPSSTGR